ncbi:isoleucine--tRNA ligase [Patescibacteria group bacterium]|nr:isoleucine--tRNA ligase [Patescibacteria group bacterium]
MDLSKRELKILKFWDKAKVFAKSVEQRKNRPTFSFYDGPPFATGLPHYGHILSSVSKDVVPRYKTMRGFKVERRWGWDCHGLPIENIIEQQLGIKNRSEIEKDIVGFNRASRRAVLKYAREWKKMVRRIGRFVDFDNSYKTMDNDYMESVWWAFKELHGKGLVYEDYRTSLYCPRCVTPLSNFEIAMDNSYKDEEDDSVYVYFKRRDKNEYFLVWTTTPWTLLANVALAINPKLTYIKVEFQGKILILAKNRLSVLGKEYRVIEKINPKDLAGVKYEPIFRQKKVESLGYRVVLADFVSADDGTGIVHIAPAFGAEDFDLGKESGLPIFNNVDEEGKFSEGQWKDQNVWEANNNIVKFLEENNHLFKKEKVIHSYPFCWRCETKLIYKVQKNWFIKISAFKKNLLAANQKINWYPLYLKNGRFGKGLETAPDWNVSRSRYWGTPIPIWRCDKCGEIRIVGSFKELKNLSGKALKDYHRPFVDKIAFRCEKCTGKMVRIPDVFDCWVESGSMPFAELHYPFENKKKFKERFPADFISEYIAQTRGWFYTLHVLSVGLFDQPSFLNAVTTGTILNEKGEKLSKSKNNFPDPWKLLEKYPMDALRLYLMTSPLMLAENLNFSEKGVKEIYRKNILTLWNSLSFFKLYSPKKISLAKSPKPENILDVWILSRVNNFNARTIELMDGYEITKAARLIEEFIEDLSNWYIRRSRRRFQKPENEKEREQAAQVLYYVLMKLAKIIAPFTPFISEEIYLSLRQSQDKESIHLCDYPKSEICLIDSILEGKMKKIREIVAEALAQRAKNGIKVRQPLAKLTIADKAIAGDKELAELIKDEVNVKEVVYGQSVKLDIKITAELKSEGVLRDLVRYIQDMRKDGGLKPGQLIYLRYQAESSLKDLIQSHEAEIKKDISAKKMETGPKKKEVFLVEKEVNFGSGKVWLGIRK